MMKNCFKLLKAIVLLQELKMHPNESFLGYKYIHTVEKIEDNYIK